MDATGKPEPLPDRRVTVPSTIADVSPEACRRDFKAGKDDRVAIDHRITLAASKQRNGRGTN